MSLPDSLSCFASRLKAAFAPLECPRDEFRFEEWALELFRLQFDANPACRRYCESLGQTPASVAEWPAIPCVPTRAFKEFDLTCLPPERRTTVFHSSGTTGHAPSRHFHCAESLALYEASLWPWFRRHLLAQEESPAALDWLALTPSPALAPHSSLAHMFATVLREAGAEESAFVGGIGSDGAWTLSVDAACAALQDAVRRGRPVALLGTAFSFVHLLDGLAARNDRFTLPAGSRLLETGGYKGRSRSLPKAGLHRLLTERLGVPPSHVICEYGMSELSSQAYDAAVPAVARWAEAAERGRPGRRGPAPDKAAEFPSTVAVSHLRRPGRPRSGSPRHDGEPPGDSSLLTPHSSRAFHFPPWARARIVSPETGAEVAEGQTGLLQVCDLANVWSVMAVQTEDLAVRRGAGFELVGRAAAAEPRGCSLTAV